MDKSLQRKITFLGYILSGETVKSKNMYVFNILWAFLVFVFVCLFCQLVLQPEVYIFSNTGIIFLKVFPNFISGNTIPLFSSLKAVCLNIPSSYWPYSEDTGNIIMMTYFPKYQQEKSGLFSQTEAFA